MNLQETLKFVNDNKLEVINNLLTDNKLYNIELEKVLTEEYGKLDINDITFEEDGNGDVSINGSWFECEGNSILVDGTDRSDVYEEDIINFKVKDVVLELFRFNI